MMERVRYVLERLERKVLELLVSDLLASLLVWQGKDVNEREMTKLLSARVLTWDAVETETPEQKHEKAMQRQEDRRAMALKRVEEGVMTPDERTPTGVGCDVHEGGTRE